MAPHFVVRSSGTEGWFLELKHKANISKTCVFGCGAVATSLETRLDCIQRLVVAEWWEWTDVGVYRNAVSSAVLSLKAAGWLISVSKVFIGGKRMF